MKKKRRKISPYFYIIFSFIGVILIGTLLFLIPFSTESGVSLSFLDAFFMTVSSVCVTGMSTIGDFGTTLSTFGKIIVCILMEIGGLSFLTITVFFVVFFKVKLGVAGAVTIKESLNQDSFKDLGKLVKKIMLIALLIQFIGAIANIVILYIYYHNFGQALGVGIFHAISSFNNAGIDIFGSSSSMIEFSNNIALNIVTMILIFLGGIGFVVIIDVCENKSFKKLKLNSKIALISSSLLIVFGSIFIYCGNINGMTYLQALFLSVSSRTAGFVTVDVNTLSNSSYVVLIILMFIGASSGSTGGGIKTSTFFIMLNVIANFTLGKTPHAFKRKIGESTIIKAFCLMFFALLFVVLMILLIFYIEQDKFSLKAIILEVVSAFSTTGISLGITASLSTASKLLICLSMFVGRVGPLTFLATMNRSWYKSSKEKVKFVEERIMVG